ncbi:hypothetical protein NUW54_g8354 [Trametes sanguinea]|uniref:Uncharacterized protein n=1 Tax=Trametes sanguinea TaxID=158606 RepID=A0ACC1PFE7_9APHY|nr:hypothetical protein NUW54_g8354 [Trametes sanguinea]
MAIWISPRRVLHAIAKWYKVRDVSDRTLSENLEISSYSRRLRNARCNDRPVIYGTPPHWPTAACRPTSSGCRSEIGTECRSQFGATSNKERPEGRRASTMSAALTVTHLRDKPSPSIAARVYASNRGVARKPPWRSGCSYRPRPTESGQSATTALALALRRTPRQQKLIARVSQAGGSGAVRGGKSKTDLRAKTCDIGDGLAFELSNSVYETWSRSDARASGRL